MDYDRTSIDPTLIISPKRNMSIDFQVPQNNLMSLDAKLATGPTNSLIRDLSNLNLSPGNRLVQSPLTDNVKLANDDYMPTVISNYRGEKPMTLDETKEGCVVPKTPGNTFNISYETYLNEIKIFQNNNLSVDVRSRSQEIVERSLVARGSCLALNPEIINEDRILFYSLDDRKIQDAVTSAITLKADLHSNIACLVDSIIGNSIPENTFDEEDIKSIIDVYGPKKSERSKNIFTSPRLIGPPSIEGYAMETSLSSSSKLFVIKTPRNRKRDNLVHEALCGLYVTNSVRRMVPNFMYVYGFSTCSPPVIKDNDVLGWCSSDQNKLSYLVSENIINSIPMKKFTVYPNITYHDVCAVLLQVFNALHIAYREYNYIHFDLHADNVLVREFESEVAIPFYNISGKIEGYIVSRYVPYIIDYGYSTFMIDGVLFTRKSGLLESVGIGNPKFPMFDVYKFLCFSAEAVYVHQKTPENESRLAKIMAVYRNMFNMFSEGFISERIQQKLTKNSSTKNSSDYDYYNPETKHIGTTYKQFISLILLQPLLKSCIKSHTYLVSKGISVINPGENIDQCTFINAIKDDNMQPRTAAAYCDFISNLVNSKTSIEYKQQLMFNANMQFSAINYIESRKSIIKNYLSKATEISQRYPGGILVPDFTEFKAYKNQRPGGRNTEGFLVWRYYLGRLSAPVDDANSLLIRSDFVKYYHNEILRLAELKNIISMLDTELRTNTCSLKIQNSYSHYESFLQNLQTEIDALKAILAKNRKVLLNNKSYFTTVNTKDIKNLAEPWVADFWFDQYSNLVANVL